MSMCVCLLDLCVPHACRSQKRALWATVCMVGTQPRSLNCLLFYWDWTGCFSIWGAHAQEESESLISTQLPLIPAAVLEVSSGRSPHPRPSGALSIRSPASRSSCGSVGEHMACVHEALASKKSFSTLKTKRNKTFTGMDILYVHVTHECLVPLEAWRGHQISWNWGHRCLWAPCR